MAVKKHKKVTKNKMTLWLNTFVPTVPTIETRPPVPPAPVATSGDHAKMLRPNLTH